MDAVRQFLSRRHGLKRPDWSDYLSYLYLLTGVLVMFGPVIWLVLSSFKTTAALNQFPPTLLPIGQETISVAGYDEPLPLFELKFDDGSVRRLAQVRRIGLQAQMIDPAQPGTIIKVNINQRTEVQKLFFAFENFTDPLTRFNFWTYLKNSVIVTLLSTLITLVINSMAAFALSKYTFAGRDAIFIITIGTLLIPISVILVPIFLVVTQIGWNNN